MVRGMAELKEEVPSYKAKESHNKQKISINQVEVLPDANFRDVLNEDRVDFFTRLYEGKADVAPIEVQLVQGGSPDSHKYIVREGIHRLTAQQRLKEKKVEALVYNTPLFTLDDIDTDEFKRHILYKALSANKAPFLPRRPSVKKPLQGSTAST